MYNFKKYEKILNEKGYYIDKEGSAYNPSGKVLKGKIKNGYKCISIRIGKRKTDVRFSRLQAYQKYGDEIYKEGIVVRHLDNVKENNSFTNIAIGTQSENLMDNPKEKRLEYAINASLKANKYSKDFVEEIRQKHIDGWSYNKIKEHYKLPKSTISYIINHKYIIHDI